MTILSGIIPIPRVLADWLNAREEAALRAQGYVPVDQIPKPEAELVRIVCESSSGDGVHTDTIRKTAGLVETNICDATYDGGKLIALNVVNDAGERFTWNDHGKGLVTLHVVRADAANTQESVMYRHNMDGSDERTRRIFGEFEAAKTQREALLPALLTQRIVSLEPGSDAPEGAVRRGWVHVSLSPASGLNA